MDRARRAGEVDPRAAVAVPERAGGRYDSALATARLTRPSTSYGTRRITSRPRKERVRGTGAELSHDVVAAEDVRAPAGPDLGRREHDVAHPRDGFDQRVVLSRHGRLRELHVETIVRAPGLAQPVDHPAVQRSRERPVRAQLVERHVVDLDDRDVPRRPSRPRSAKRASTSRSFLRAHGVPEPRRGGDGGDEDADAEEEERSDLPPPRPHDVLRTGEVTVALFDRHRAALRKVEHRDRASLHRRERAVTAVVGQPVRPAHGRRAVPPLRPEPALPVTPETADAPLLRGRRRLRNARLLQTPKSPPASVSVVSSVLSCVATNLPPVTSRVDFPPFRSFATVMRNVPRVVSKTRPKRNSVAAVTGTNGPPRASWTSTLPLTAAATASAAAPAWARASGTASAGVSGRRAR